MKGPVISFSFQKRDALTSIFDVKKNTHKKKKGSECNNLFGQKGRGK